MSRKLIVSGIVLCFALAHSILARHAAAGVNVIGQLPQQSSGFGYNGLSFDTDPNPVVLARWEWTLRRIDKTSAAVLSAVTSNPVTSFNDQLVFDRTTLNYLTVGYSSDTNQDTLVSIDPVNYNHSTIGALGVGFPNFHGLAIDPSGSLWYGADVNGGAKLWSLDKSTGAATLSREITFPGGLQFHTLTFGSDGTLYVAASAYQFDDGGEGIYRVDRNNGIATFLTSTDRGAGFQTIQSFSQDPLTHRYYGISGPTDTNNRYYLVEITGVPEPSGLTVLCAGALWLRRRRR
jgi:sugar lactone lactonase YvrE